MRNAQNITQTLMNVCHQIHKQGMQPTVALLRAKAPLKISLSQAIEAVRQYSSQDPNSFEADFPAESASAAAPETQSCTPLGDADRIRQLESEVAQLKVRMAKLEALVADSRN